MPRPPKPIAMTGDEFRAILDAAGVSQQQAAVTLGVHDATVSRWLNDQSRITEESAKIIRERIQVK